MIYKKIKIFKLDQKLFTLTFLVTFIISTVILFWYYWRLTYALRFIFYKNPYNTPFTN